MSNNILKDSQKENAAAENSPNENAVAENGANQTAQSGGDAKKQSRKAAVIQALKFLFFSTGAGIIQFGSFTLFSEVFHWETWLCHLIALILSVLFNFTLNRKFTFKAANNVAFAMFLAFLFYVPFTPLSTWYVKALSDRLSEAQQDLKYLIEFSVMVINLVTEFIYTKFVVYGVFNKRILQKKTDNPQDNASGDGSDGGEDKSGADDKNGGDN
jgi:putative flippase GtrA